MGILEFARKNTLIFDGAMGTMLQKTGLALGENPDLLNITAPKTVADIHRAYFEAGANVVTTNTLGSNDSKLAGTGYTASEVIAAAIELAKGAAIGADNYVALDIGPIGELLEPMGTLSFDDAYGLYKEQVLAGVKAGADLIIIETMTDLYETKCALLAAKENSSLPVICTMTFEENMRTFLGCPISSMALTLEGLGADFIGINCSLGPSQIYPMAEELLKWTKLPILIQPNAGMPEIVDGAAVYNVSEEEFCYEMSRILKLGVNAVGGCCGTTPEYIRLLKDMAREITTARREAVVISAVCSHTKTVLIDRVRIIGERINPTGKKRFKQALADGDIEYIISQAIEQSEAGADILDVNVGLPGINETDIMVKAVKEIQSIVDLPLQIDSSAPCVIDAALRAYNGKAIVNSVNGEEEVLDRILPIVKKYGAAVVGLTLDKNGIPKTAGERFLIAKKIVSRAEYYGISKNDVFIDCLTLTASAEQEAAYETIKAMELVKKGLGVKTVLGVSNISFGLPARDKLNQAFLTIALHSGLDLPIINPNITEMVDAVYCYHQLKNIDSGSGEYIKRFGGAAASGVRGREEGEYDGNGDIAFYIKNGLKEEARRCCEELLTGKETLEIVDGVLMPILDEVGVAYEENRIFLPQLLQSAEAAKAAFEVIAKKVLSRPGTVNAKKDKILLATVKGDIHDIGKNIVKVILENYGYEVIDLGKDVEIQAVVDAAVKNKVSLVGLSALMTTTLESMEQTIAELKRADPQVYVMVGGAVLTEDYAQKIGADFYARDAMSAVAIAKGHFTKQAVEVRRV